jgi:uncharacterized protein YjiS (DUF1127 family)
VKATLEFTLPEESDEHYTACNAQRYRAAVSTVYEWMRHKRKYTELSESDEKLIDDLWRTLLEEVEDLRV